MTAKTSHANFRARTLTRVTQSLCIASINLTACASRQVLTPPVKPSPLARPAIVPAKGQFIRIMPEHSK